jgi:hypothetical protein
MRDGGQLYTAGAVVERETGTVHDYSASEDRPLVIATVHRGIVPVLDDD